MRNTDRVAQGPVGLRWSALDHARALVLVMAALAFMSSLNAGDVAIAYPTDEAPSFYLTVPDDWERHTTTEAGGYYDIISPAGAVFSFRLINGPSDPLDEMAKDGIAQASERYDSASISEPKDWSPSGLQGLQATGTGKDKEDGSSIRMAMGWCMLPNGSVAEYWFITDSADDAGVDAATRIANSLSIPKQK